MDNEKNLALMDNIMNGIMQTGECDEIPMHDPMITVADARWDAAIEQVKTLIPEELYAELHDAYMAGADAFGDADILYGIHVADAIRDVASRPADLSRHVLKRIEEARA